MRNTFDVEVEFKSAKFKNNETFKEICGRISYMWNMKVLSAADFEFKKKTLSIMKVKYPKEFKWVEKRIEKV